MLTSTEFSLRMLLEYSRDPLAITIKDEDPDEERFVTIGTRLPA